MDGEVTDLMESAIATHELFMSYMKAGFRPNQAIYLTASVMTGAPLHAPPGMDDSDDS